MPALSRAREQGKRAVCLGNLKQLSLAWILYTDDNNDRIVLNETSSRGWVGWSGGNAGEAAQIRDIESGLLFPYVKNINFTSARPVCGEKCGRTL